MRLCFAFSFVVLLSSLSFPWAPLSAQEGTYYYFEYDRAGNNIRRTVVRDDVESIYAMPGDPAGRNHPVRLGNTPLAWGPGGHLTAKRDLRFWYDDRGRLTRVGTPTGEELARYVHGPLGRRIGQIYGDEVVETVWAGWQPVETYENGKLRSRRTYGTGLDEVVRLEQDLDGDGILDATYLPIYDLSGHIALVAGLDGKPIERYAYSPFGQRTITVDSTPPEIEQVRMKNGELWLEISEAIFEEPLMRAVANGAITLTVESSPASPFEITAALPVRTGRQADRRIALTFASDVPAPGTAITLRIEPPALADRFLNQLGAPFELAASWPAGEAVLFDNAAPVIDSIDVRDRVVEVEFTEPVDPASARDAIRIDGNTMDWSPDETGYRLTGSIAPPTGLYDLEISTTLEDLAGMPLAEAFERQVLIAEESGFSAWYRRPNPREIPSSAIANDLGFHGLPHDPVTGFIFMRHRDYDPELGRFITPDPMGYADGPSPYAAFGNNPINRRDPFGLYSGTPEEIEEAWRQGVHNPGDGALVDEVAAGVVHGAAMMPVDSVRGLYESVRHPIQTVQGLYYVMTHVPTVVRDAWEQFKAASPYEKGRMAGSLEAGLITGGGASVKGLRMARKEGRGRGNDSAEIDSSSGSASAIPDPASVRFPTSPGQIQHIFREAPGHLSDTPANRKLLQDLAEDPLAVVGTDQFGSIWAAQTLEDGTQVWVQVRDEIIQNGGVNATLRTFGPEMGLTGP